MKTFLITVIIFILTSAIVGQEQRSTMRILTAADFAEDHIDRGSGRESLALSVQIDPRLAPYTLNIVPDPAVTDTGGSDNPPHHVGWIEISAGESPAILQKIDVRTMAGVVNLTRYFTAEDVNFDGFLDIAVVNDFGAKWVKVNYWLYNKHTGRFVASPLTHQLEHISHAYKDLDNKTKTISFRNYFGTCPQNDVYKVMNQRLVLVEKEERVCIAKGQEILVKTFVKRRVKGRMKLVKIKLESHEATGALE